MYVYRNLIYAPSDNLYSENLGIYFHLGTTLRLFLYHNSVSAFQATALGSTQQELGLGNVFYVNNILSAPTFGGVTGTAAYPHFDYNWVGGDVTLESYMGPHNVLKPGTLLWTAGDTQLLVGPGNSAHEAGLDLSAPFTLDGQSVPALPGMSPGYFSGSAPDLGYRP